MTKIYRDAKGNCINIGEWDYMYEEKIVHKASDFSDLTFETNIDDYKPKTVIVARNPMPEFAFEDEAEVVVGIDGSLYLADDPRVSQSEEVMSTYNAATAARGI